MIVTEHSAAAVEGDVLLSVWRRPYTLEALDGIESLIVGHVGRRLSSFAVFRFERIHPGDFANPLVRARMIEISKNHPYRRKVNVLDGRGIVNGTIRMAISGVLAVFKPPFPMITVESIDAGLTALNDVEPNRKTLRASLALLELALWPAGPRDG